MHRIVANWHFIEEGMRIPEGWGGESITAHVVFIGVLKLRHSSGGRERYLVEPKNRPRSRNNNTRNLSAASTGSWKSFQAPGVLTAQQKSLQEWKQELYLCCRPPTIHEWDCTTAQREHNKTLSELNWTKCTPYLMFARRPSNNAHWQMAYNNQRRQNEKNNKKKERNQTTLT